MINNLKRLYRGSDKETTNSFWNSVKGEILESISESASNGDSYFIILFKKGQGDYTQESEEKLKPSTFLKNSLLILSDSSSSLKILVTTEELIKKGFDVEPITLYYDQTLKGLKIKGWDLSYQENNLVIDD